MGITIDDTDPAIRIDRKAAKVLLRSGGRRLDFTHVVIATGARVRRLPIEGDDLDGVVQLRTLQDARILRELLRSPRSVVVIGGGFIGTEVAAAAVKNGHGVTIIESTTRLMSRVVSPDVSNFVTSVHQQRGTVVRLNASASAIVGKEGKAIAVKLDNGETIPADVVVSGIGVLPNTELAADAGLAVHNGVLVNAHLRTTDPPRISAIGDCAAFLARMLRGRFCVSNRCRMRSIKHVMSPPGLPPVTSPYTAPYRGFGPISRYEDPDGRHRCRHRSDNSPRIHRRRFVLRVALFGRWPTEVCRVC